MWEHVHVKYLHVQLKHFHMAGTIVDRLYENYLINKITLSIVMIHYCYYIHDIYMYIL